MTHRYQVRAYYDHTDAGGVVYHAEYLGFAEQARTEMLREAGYPHADMQKNDNRAFVVRHIDIDYQNPAMLDDVLTIESDVVRVGGASCDIRQIVKRGDQVICVLTVVLVCLELESFTAFRIPSGLRSHLKSVCVNDDTPAELEGAH